jgi:hypothetical protein
MKNKYAYLLAALAVVIVLIAYSAMTLNSLQPTQNGNSSGTVQKIEVIHFHPTQQCVSCRTVGAYAEETVNTFFQNELSTGKLTFQHINGELANNSAIVQKYGATGSSLWIGTYDNNGFHAEQNLDVWYKIGNKTEFMGYLRGVIEDKLNGA